MTAFFITTGRQKCIAASAVREAIQRQLKGTYGGSIYWELRDADGRHLGDTYQNPMTMGPITPGSGEALVVSVDESESRPTAADIYVQLQPIVGWRAVEGLVEPVLPEDVVGECRIMFVMSDGSLLEPGIAHWTSVEAMKAGVLAHAQEWWDRKHNSKTEQTP